MQPKRLYEWDNAKGFLILCVVIGHIGNFFAESCYEIAVIQFWVYLFHMPAFIYISGVFSKRAVEKKQLTRAVSFVFLYLFMELLFYLCDVWTKGGAKASLDLLHENSVPWYALAMCWFLLLTIAAGKVNPVIVIAFSLLVSVLSGYVDLDLSFLVLRRTCVFYPFFYLGFRTDPAKLMKTIRRPGFRLAGLAVLCGSAWYVWRHLDQIRVWRKLFRGRYSYHYILKSADALSGSWRLAAILISLILTFCILSVIPGIPTVLSVLGRKSLPVFVWHYPLLRILTGKVDGFSEWIKGDGTGLKCLCLALVLCFVTSLPVFEIPVKTVMELPRKIRK